ncbi:protein of unassigned function [Methylobacterium oryzae CBMB20]|uniref:Protein of unassigned function n=1 Tax=Methylobacterium oryzae CBMB20 TaxID=693986 RepID=A0A089NNI8_9HYPH|nr:protein of unassigned function [Methylobacterium oryzae CBMB20]
MALTGEEASDSMKRLSNKDAIRGSARVEAERDMAICFPSCVLD